MKKLLVSLIAVAGLTGAANAQTTNTASKNEDVKIELKDVVELTLTSNAGATGTSFLFDDVDKYENGLTQASASTLKVRSNKDWQIKVEAAADNFTSTSATVMPCSVLKVGYKNATYTALTKAGAVLATGTRGSTAAPSNTFDIGYQATPGFSYNEGTYQLNVVYTLTQP